MLRSLSLALTFTTFAFAHAPAHIPGRRTWYHERDHPVHKLFPRASTDGTDYPEVGSATWSASYPSTTPDPEQMPQAWKDALNAAVADGRIPNFPPSVLSDTGFPTYIEGHDPQSPEVCSSTYKCRVDGQIWDAPDGSIGIGFDDGPEAGTHKLVEFLTQQQETATHFLVGVNILNNPEEFMAIFNQGGDMAVHTYTHPYMTSLTNEQVAAQLGWTMEIIRNSTGGRIPKYWRPPFGDSDNRVRAIAEEVFGMEVIMWNQDTDDWAMSTGGQTMEGIATSMNTWLTGPKSPGLIILEHELTDDTVQAFMDAFPIMKSNGWQTKSMALLVSDSAYQNSDGVGEGSSVTPASVVLSQSEPAKGGSGDGNASSPQGSSTRQSTRTASSPSSSSSPNTNVLHGTTSENSATDTAMNALFAFAAVLVSAFMV